MDKITLRHELKQRLMQLSRQEIADKASKSVSIWRIHRFIRMHPW
jgi:hypothetical protein